MKDPRIFYANPELAPCSGDGSFLGITEGEVGFSCSMVYTQDHADELNKRQGITPAMVEAAVGCSMFNNWDKFEKIVGAFDKAA